MADDPEAGAEALAAAWDALRAGQSLDAVLAAHPAAAAELEPLLRLGLALQETPRPPLTPAAQARILDRARAAGAHRRPQAGLPARPGRLRLPGGRRWRALPQLGAIATLLLVLAAVAVVTLRGGAVGPLSPATATPALVTYVGTVEAVGQRIWSINDHGVLVDAATEVHGSPVVGATVRCQGEPTTGPGYVFRATAIWVLPGTPAPSPPAPDYNYP